MNFVEERSYCGEYCVVLKSGTYEATVLPEMGANLISFKDTERNLAFLREPGMDGFEDFKERPTNYGVPVLFPPNRIDNGTFTIEGVPYQFPVNEVDRQNHLHGFLHSAKWYVEESGTSATDAFVRLSVTIDENHEVYKYFPHHFKILIEYRLSGAELTQFVQVQNLGQTRMPVMLGFHTALNVPFSDESSSDDYELVVSIGERWELDDRMLPTGRKIPLSENELLLMGEGSNPFVDPLDNHYTARPKDGRNFATLKDKRNQVLLTYEVDVQYSKWMIWNEYASGHYVCPEPQTNLTNAANVDVSEDDKGIIMLDSGETFSSYCSWSVRDDV